MASKNITELYQEATETMNYWFNQLSKPNAISISPQVEKNPPRGVIIIDISDDRIDLYPTKLNKIIGGQLTNDFIEVIVKPNTSYPRVCANWLEER